MHTKSAGEAAVESEKHTTIVLVSRKREFYRQLKEILPDLPGPTPVIRWGDFDETDGEADLYIWDYYPGLSIPAAFVSRSLHSHLFVLDRGSLQAFRQSVPIPDAVTLLNPIASGTLRAKVIQAIIARATGGQSGNEQEVDSLRSDRAEILECLLQANIKLQEYDQERTNFLARAVHDFRAPLTAITGYCGLLLAEQLGELTAAQQEVLRRMQRSTARLSRMSNAMFELSIGNRVSSTHPAQCCDIRECIDQAVHEMLPRSTEKNISISLDVTPPTGRLFVEGSHVEQVMVNLLDNALKFTPKGAAVLIKAYPCFWERRSAEGYRWREENRRVGGHNSPNAYQVDIQDNGPGIPPHELDTIFDEYTSYSGGQDRSGGGLGLAICKSIMNQHHGRVWAENSAPTGAVFSFVLPMNPGEQCIPQNQAIEGTLNGCSAPNGIYGTNQ